ncbi:MAG TPA: N-acetylmuramoyl-L-alanine amidase [Kofleriaceae bacterium]
MRIALFATAALVGCGLSPAEAPVERTPVAGSSPLADIFTRVSLDTGVPADVLAAVSWNETRFHFATPGGEHSHAFETGLMALTESGPRDLHRGAMLAGVSEHTVRTDVEASIRAGAALLREQMIDGDVTRALRAYGGTSFAHAIDKALARGIDGRDDAGRAVVVAARAAARVPGFSSVTQAAGYPGAEWIPAYSGNYQVANRGVGDITSIIIHDTEGSYSGTISWFKDPDANVSAHYVIRSSDGHIAQMVDEKNVAWHIACFNTSSIGLEHEGYAAKPDQWFTEAMYAESAKLTAYLADKYMIEKSHGPIQGHGEAPDCSTHTDPGPGWKWDHYIDLVRTGGAPQFTAADIVVEAPKLITSGELATVTVTIKNTGTAAWDLDATRIGTADPQDRPSALFVDGDWLGPDRPTAVDGLTEAGTSGTFTFQIRGPDVSEAKTYDEAFSFVQEGVTWFGPTFHVVLLVQPSGDEPGGCSATSSGGVVSLLLLALLRRRKRRAFTR